MNNLFNSPIEIATRILFIFKNSRKPIDLQRLIYYNYLLIHSSDVEGGPKSLHPNLPNRSCYILVNRCVLSKALSLLLSKGLIDVIYSKQKGILYKQNKLTEPFLNFLDSEYSKKLNYVGIWIVNNFESYSDSKLDLFIKANLGKWGGEFVINQIE